MAQRVGRDLLVGTGGDGRALERTGEPFLEQVMPPFDAGARVDGELGSGEHPVPCPRLARARIFALQRIGHRNARALRSAIRVPERVRPGQLLAQQVRQRARKHDDAVLGSLAFTHDDGVAVEVDVLDAQRQSFHQAHAGAVEEASDEPDLSIKKCEEPVDLGDGEHGRDALLVLRPADFIKPGEVLAEDFLVEKEQGAEGLAMGGYRDLALGGEHGKERLDLGFSHLAWVLQAMEVDEEARPVKVGFFGTKAVVQIANAFAQLRHDARGLQRRRGRSFAGFVCVF